VNGGVDVRSERVDRNSDAIEEIKCAFLSLCQKSIGVQ